MTAPTAADYTAALAAMDATPFCEVLDAALVFVRARLAADVAMERYMETAVDNWSLTHDDVTALGDECDRLKDVAADAYRAFVALAANADGGVE